MRSTNTNTALRRNAITGAAALAFALCGAPLLAQSNGWSTVQQASSWYAAFVDHALTGNTALWFDAQWRRMGLVNEPQQVLIRPGLQRTIAPGVRLAGGYAYIATAPYGELPAASPSREHRTWQQLLLNHRAGGLSVTHRYRWEQRWLSSVVNETNTPSTYQQRARYMVRAQGNVPSLHIGSRPVLGFVWDELLVPVGHGDATVRVAQNRLGAGIGVPIDTRQRVELGYMNLWNALPSQRANEINHTFTLSWVWIVSR